MSPAQDRADSGQAAIDIVAQHRPCPHADECRRAWQTLPGRDVAVCLCYQFLPRSVLAEMLAEAAS